MSTAIPQATAAKKAHQHQEGFVQYPAPAPPQPRSCFPGITRNLAILFGEDEYNGVFGYLFDVNKKTWGKPFRLELTEAQLAADLDISFYAGLGEPYPGAAPENEVFETRAAGGEAGIVPEKMTKAIVCMYTGYNSQFSYAAGAGVPPPPKD